ncbi:MAG: DUF1007 family protein [Spirochaetales bacterium]|nr:DUF1007 family protein [Spirochaetales bacterium]
MRNIGGILLICAFFLFPAIRISCHPHVFIENKFTFVFDETGLDGIRVTWIFDEMFSASVIMDYDDNGNNIFERNESKAVEEGAFSNLINYNYFMHINVNNRRKKIITSVKDFKAEISGSTLVYTFFVPLHVKAVSKDQVIKAGSYDKSYFCCVFNAEVDPFVAEKSERFECSLRVIEDKENVYWVTIIPKVAVLHLRLNDE